MPFSPQVENLTHACQENMLNIINLRGVKKSLFCTPPLYFAKMKMFFQILALFWAKIKIIKRISIFLTAHFSVLGIEIVDFFVDFGRFFLGLFSLIFSHFLFFCLWNCIFSLINVVLLKGTYQFLSNIFNFYKNLTVNEKTKIWTL